MNDIAQTIFWGELIGKIMLWFFLGSSIIGIFVTYYFCINAAYDVGVNAAVDDFKKKEGLK